MSLPCYYCTVGPEEDQRMSAVCVECKKEKNINGWYWPGNLKGYGEPLVMCHVCQKEIHNNEDK